MIVERGRDVPLPEAVTRTVRHEVGDLLQSLYATVMLLQQRLPPEADLERRLLADLRNRAERCRDLLDTALDLILPPALHPESVDLRSLTASLVQEASARHPHLRFRTDLVSTRVHGDPMRLAQAGRFLLLHCCTNAREQVWVRLSAPTQADEVEWEFRDDGPSLSLATLERMFVPFAAPRQGLSQVGAALAGQLVTRQGGRISAQNLPGSGVQLLACLPAGPREDLELK